MKTKKKKGFTLTELIVVIVIIGVLAAVMIPSLTGYITKAQNSNDETLVTLLNQELEHQKLLNDDLEFYTAYDVNAFLKEVNRENIEVANKKSIILFDTEINQFVLVKENEQSKALVKTEFVYHISEYYSINHNYYDAEETNTQIKTSAVLKLGYSKLSNSKCDKTDCKTHRAFIVSTNGPEIVKAVKAVMDLPIDNNGSNVLEVLKELDTDTYKLVISSITKTMYLTKTEAYYYDSDLNKVIYDNSKGQPDEQKLTRVIILPEVDEVDFNLISTLAKSVITVPETANTVETEKVNLASGSVVIGNTNTSDEIDYDNVYKTLKATEEAEFNNPYVYNESQLYERLSYYKNKGTDETVIIMKSFTVRTEINIPNNVTLFIPYDLNRTNLETNSDSTKEIKLRDGVVKTIPDHANTSHKDGYTPYYGEYDYKKNLPFAHTVDGLKTIDLIIESNITVNGSIIIGGITGDGGQGLEGHTSDKYGQITLNGEMILEKDSYLYCYGYIIGDGTITAKSKSTILQPFVIGDFNGGSEAYELYQNRRCPFDKYALVNIQTNVYLVNGSYYLGMAKIFADKLKVFSGYDTAINIVSKENGLICVGENTDVLITYDDSKKLNKGKNAFFDAVGQTTFEIFGTDGKKGSAKTGTITIEINIVVNEKLDSTNFPISVPYNFQFEFKNGTYEINSDFALLPGATITVASDATLTINESASIYLLDGSQSNKFTSIVEIEERNYLTETELKSLGYETSGKLYLYGILTVNGTLAGTVDAKVDKESTIKPKIIMTSTANTQNNFFCVKQWSEAKTQCEHKFLWEHKKNCYGHQKIGIDSLAGLYILKCYDEHSGECWQLSPTSIIFGMNNVQYNLGSKAGSVDLNTGTYKYDGENWEKIS